MIEYLEKGGIIMYILFGMNILGFSLMIWKLIVIIVSRRRKDQMFEVISQQIKKERINDEHLMENFVKEEIHTRLQQLEFGLNTVRVIASVAPLLGLLGTVIGITKAFEMISRVGLDDPTLFAEGISLALITTVGGLIVAIPHYIGYNFLIGMIDRMDGNWDKEAFKILQKVKQI